MDVLPFRLVLGPLGGTVVQIPANAETMMFKRTNVAWELYGFKRKPDYCPDELTPLAHYRRSDFVGADGVGTFLWVGGS